jgi:enhancing lycopene biosynthesis protein 2
MEKKKKFAVVLSGCGVFDGSEIHEAVMTLYAILKNHGEYEIFAPDIPQHHVINHLTGKEMAESRNVLIESARIARGKVKPLSEFKAGDFDSVIFPGGFGAAKNLSGFAFDPANFTIEPEVERTLKEMVNLGKPVGALCISPVLLARVLESPVLTIGNDAGTADALERLGATHKQTGHGEVAVDRKYRIVTTPCYMLDASVLQIAEGADAAVKALLQMMEEQD